MACRQTPLRTGALAKLDDAGHCPPSWETAKLTKQASRANRRSRGEWRTLTVKRVGRGGASALRPDARVYRHQETGPTHRREPGLGRSRPSARCNGDAGTAARQLAGAAPAERWARASTSLARQASRPAPVRPRSSTSAPHARRQQFHRRPGDLAARGIFFFELLYFGAVTGQQYRYVGVGTALREPATQFETKLFQVLHLFAHLLDGHLHLYRHVGEFQRR